MAIDLTDAGGFFTDFAETVVYCPRSGVRRSVQAVVDRSPPQDLSEAAGVAGAGIQVHVRNSATLGIASSELDIGGDRIELALRLGATAQARPISRLVSQDAGILTLEVQ